MIEITREKIEKLYKAQKFAMHAYVVICTVVIVGAALALKIYESATGKSYDIFLILFPVCIAVSIVGIFISKRFVPAGNGRKVNEAYRIMQKDFISENTINILYKKIGETENYADKTKLILLLCDTYMMRGQINEAINLLDSVDRSKFTEYPEIGMSFYDDTIGLYSLIDDNDSVLRAYEDAIPFIEHCYERNYVCFSIALNIEINMEKAKENYRRALELKLLKNEFKNKENTDIDKYNNFVNNSYYRIAPVNKFTSGMVFYDTSELFYLCGDYQSAGKYLDIGGPMLAASPYMTKKANELSEKIRTALNKA